MWGGRPRPSQQSVPALHRTLQATPHRGRGRPRHNVGRASSPVTAKRPRFARLSTMQTETSKMGRHGRVRRSLGEGGGRPSPMSSPRNRHDFRRRSVGCFSRRERRAYLNRYVRSESRGRGTEKQLTGRGPEGCDENGPAAALLLGCVSI